MPEQLAMALAPDARVTPERRRVRRRHLLVIDGGAQLLLFRRRRIPTTRGDCSWARDSEGLPCCPYLSCRHHLWTDRLDAFEGLVDAPPAVWPQTCSLDVADAVDAALPGERVIAVGQVLKRADAVEDGTLTLADVGRHLGCSGERARQIEAQALEAMGYDEQIIETYGLDRLDWYGDPE